MTQEQIQVTEVQTLRLPAIAIRGLVMFPKMVLHFDVARQKSILALNKAMQGNQKIFLVTQKDSRIEHPKKEDLVHRRCSGKGKTDSESAGRGCPRSGGRCLPCPYVRADYR